MPPRDNIRAQGAIIEVLQDGAYRVELANGHRCVAHTSRKPGPRVVPFALGDHVSLEFHPYDLSRGRIIFPE